MDLLEYENKTTTLEVIKNIINRGNVEKTVFCGIGLYTIISNSTIGKVGLSLVFIRKLYGIYKNNKHDINLLIDRII